MKNRSEKIHAGNPHSECSQNSAGRGQILSILQVNSYSIDQKSDEICTGQTDLQPISFKSDRLPCSAAELETQLALNRDLGYGKLKQYGNLQDAVEEVMKLLRTYINRMTDKHDAANHSA